MLVVRSPVGAVFATIRWGQYKQYERPGDQCEVEHQQQRCREDQAGLWGKEGGGGEASGGAGDKR